MAMNPNVEQSGKIRVLLVEDHPMFREHLAGLISREADMMVCGQTDNVRDAMRLVLDEKPNLAIVDITLKDASGLEFLKDMRAQEIQMPVLVLSMHEESLYAERILQAGAKGYVCKNKAATEVMSAIRHVLSGAVYLSPEVTASLLKRMSEGRRTMNEVGPQSLTDRELEIFQLIGRGKNVEEIAKLLSLGKSTVESYRTRMRLKLGVRNAAALYSLAATWVRDEGKMNG
ncbi:MAG: response regulator transcription factor [Chthoniobacteraceae bacterium]